MTLLARDLGASLRAPAFWTYSSWLDILSKYRRSRLGLVWLLLPPVLYVVGVGMMYSKLQGSPPAEFMAHMGIGYLVYRLVTTVIVESCTVFAGHSSFILDGHVRLTDFILRTLAKAFFYLLAALPVVATAVALSPEAHATGVLLALPGLALVLVNLFWFGVALALLGSRFPDVSEFTGSLLIFAFLFTPILWTPDQMPADTMRGAVARVNPLFHLIEVVRAPILGGHVEKATFLYLGVMTVCGCLFAGALYRRYSRFVPLWI